jgi:hypothetical protein
VVGEASGVTSGVVPVCAAAVPTIEASRSRIIPQVEIILRAIGFSFFSIDNFGAAYTRDNVVEPQNETQKWVLVRKLTGMKGFSLFDSVRWCHA